MGVLSSDFGSTVQAVGHSYGSVLYVAFGAIAVGAALLTEAELGPTYVLTGALAGSGFHIVRHVLETQPLVRQAYDIAVFVSVFILATRDVTGKLAMVGGACIATVVVSYWLYVNRD